MVMEEVSQSSLPFPYAEHVMYVQREFLPAWQRKCRLSILLNYISCILYDMSFNVQVTYEHLMWSDFIKHHLI
jgi:hypothetical protein